MANTTFFLDKPAGAPLSSNVAVAQKVIDFSKNPVVNGDTFDAIRVPAGAVIMNLFMIVNTADTNTTATIALARSVTAGGPTIAATALDANNKNIISDPDEDTDGMYCPVADTIRGTIGTANTSDAKVTIGMTYYVPAPVTSA